MVFEKLKKQFPDLRKNEPLKKHCSFRVGGPAKYFYELRHIEELPKLIAVAQKNALPYRFIGRGTNILFADKGFNGLIIKNISNNCRIEENCIISDSGVILAQIVRLSVDNNLTGIEPLFGIPGTIGGAVWGNAGVPGCEIGSFVKTLTIFDAKNGLREIDGKKIHFGYRHSSLQENHLLILRVKLTLKKSIGKKSRELIKKINEIRRGKQPTGYSAGSFFKNPSPDKPAGLLIDRAGLKGFSVGDAVISEKHGNFFLNRGNATAKEILELAQIAKTKVKEKFGINLELEVKIIDDL